MKKLFIIFILLMSLGCNVSPRKVSAENQQAKKTEKLLTEANNKIGMPNVRNFQQKKVMKMILEACDQEDLICYAYLQSEYSGKLVFIGKCVGYGVPFSAQYTNPEHVLIERNSLSAGDVPYTVPQADPNGLYMPTSSSATWLMMLDEEGKPHPVYFEPTITVSPFRLNLQDV